MGLHEALQSAIITAIEDDSYAFSLPSLVDCDALVRCSSSEKQRLEFLGDALLHASVALYLNEVFPDASPGMYTSLRAAINANATFTHLMVKAGVHHLDSESRTTKAAADTFEVIIAAFYMERGFADLRSWVKAQFSLLVTAAHATYHNMMAKKRRNVVLSRRAQSACYSGTPFLKKIRLGRSVDRVKTPSKIKAMARNVLKKMALQRPGSIRLPIRKGKKTRISPCRSFVDLTWDDDPEVVLVKRPNAPKGRADSNPSTPRSKSPPMSRTDTVRRAFDSTKLSQKSSSRSIVGHSLNDDFHRGPPNDTSTYAGDEELSSSSRPGTSPPTYDLFRKAGLSLATSPDDDYLGLGTFAQPIMIYDSDEGPN